QLPVRDRKGQRPSESQLAHQLQRVARSPVLDDPAVREAADHDAPELHLATLLRTAKRPARGDLVSLRDLVVDLEAQIGKQGQIEGDRPAGALMPAIGEAVDVVDEVRVVVPREPVGVSARAGALEGAAGGLGVVGGGGGRHGSPRSDGVSYLDSVYYLNR